MDSILLHILIYLTKTCRVLYDPFPLLVNMTIQPPLAEPTLVFHTFLTCYHILMSWHSIFSVLNVLHLIFSWLALSSVFTKIPLSQRGLSWTPCLKLYFFPPTQFPVYFFITMEYFIYFIHLVYYLSLSTAGKLPECTEFLLCLLLHFQHMGQCLIYSRHSLNICWIN